MRIISNKNTSTLKTKTDHELVTGFKASGNNLIIGELYDRYAHIVLGICLKYLKNNELANDAQSQIFTDLFELLKKYEVKEFKSWLFTITRNYCLRKLKTESKSVSFINDTENNISTEFMENEEEIAHLKYKEKLFKNLEMALEKLKPEQKKCVVLFYLDGKTYQDIEKETGYPLKKVKSYIQNGKRNLELIMNRIK